MSTKLCLWFGLLAGAFVGLLLGLLHGIVCCTPPQPPTWAQLAFDGLVIAVVTTFIAAAFACLLSHLAILPTFVLAFIVAILVGILLGPLAYHLPHPLLALILCGILGIFLGWVVCRLFCRDLRTLQVEVGR